MLASRQVKVDLRLAVKLRPATIDDFGAIRHVHESALRASTENAHSPVVLAALLERVREADFAGDLIGHNLQLATIDDYILGTAGWTASPSNHAVARITDVMVHPLFRQVGVGRLLVTDAEVRAQAQGFEGYRVRATEPEIGFFEQLGYRICGRQTVPFDEDLTIEVQVMEKSASRMAFPHVEPVDRPPKMELRGRPTR